MTTMTRGRFAFQVVHVDHLNYGHELLLTFVLGALLLSVGVTIAAAIGLLSGGWR